MPIFEYICRACGHEFELLVRSQMAQAQGLCPECESQQIQKRFSTFACNTRGQSSQTTGPAPACTGPV